MAHTGTSCSKSTKNPGETGGITPAGASLKALPKSKARSFTGCWACRFKKRRCDERRPFCSLCTKHGDSCSYDVRLMWLQENMFRVSRKDGRLESEAAGTDGRRRERLSKKEFRQLTQFRGHGGDNRALEQQQRQRETQTVGQVGESISRSARREQGEDESEEENRDSFTISVRRLKVYDNAVRVIHGTPRRFDARYVEEQLERNLKKLDAGHIGQAGPYSAIWFERFKGRVDKGRVRSMGSVGGKDGSVGGRGAGCTGTSCDSCGRQVGEQVGKEDRQLLAAFFPEHWNMLISKFNNTVLQNTEYVKWLSGHVQSLAANEMELPRELLRELMSTRNIDIRKWLQRVEMRSTEIRSVCYLLLMLKTDAPELNTKVRNWLVSCGRLPFSAYPLIVGVLTSIHSYNYDDASIEALINCENLVDCVGSTDVLQGQFTCSIKSDICRNMVAFCSGQLLEAYARAAPDVAGIEMQLKYWEFQLKQIEQVYNDTYTSTNTSTADAMASNVAKVAT
ncbi:Thi2p Ecym_2263 [Eremothecium cymbalariae DBVPG|uniref:Zn(2)-C6 fungal-type domain-containing protein n=1 Tax=Eremothecium cymbalariae (strain CBS 270.75 / DBVPG 7215 / KCTC 17166 / NRRL Y-17582) TaxID=931890 RepID=G8JPQ4_ERECY|nr:Hypothetical protein Ecym_2263 [Eremothecium cymbalariae DBVPG\